jgi:hypothetical protein
MILIGGSGVVAAAAAAHLGTVGGAAVRVELLVQASLQARSRALQRFELRFFVGQQRRRSRRLGPVAPGTGSGGPSFVLFHGSGRSRARGGGHVGRAPACR